MVMVMEGMAPGRAAAAVEEEQEVEEEEEMGLPEMGEMMAMASTAEMRRRSLSL